VYIVLSPGKTVCAFCEDETSSLPLGRRTRLPWDLVLIRGLKRRASIVAKLCDPSVGYRQR